MLWKGEIVKNLKDAKANDIDVARAVSELKARKHALDNKVSLKGGCR